MEEEITEMDSILYLEENLINAGSQIIIVDINETFDIINKGETQVLIEDTFEEVKLLLQKMYTKQYMGVREFDGEELPLLGDVIWVETGGRKWIANCIVRQKDGNLHEEAFRLCMRSVKKKCIELKQAAVAMTIIDKDNWNNIYPIIQEELRDTVVFVHISTNDKLMEVLDNLPGGFNEREFEITPIIKFK